MSRDYQAPDWRDLCEQLVAELERCRPLAEVPDCLARARAALAQPEPEVVGPDCERNWDSILSPSGGYEMAEDAALRDGAQLVNGEWWAPVFGCDSLESVLGRIRERLQRQAAPVPVPVSERLPEPSVKVLAHYFNDLGKGRTICAIWVPAKTRSDSYGDDDFTEYDEESDTFYWPEGWYEAIENWDDLGYVKVDEGEVIYWEPLPKWPAHALPLPSGEVQP